MCGRYSYLEASGKCFRDSVTMDQIRTPFHTGMLAQLEESLVLFVAYGCGLDPSLMLIFGAYFNN